MEARTELGCMIESLLIRLRMYSDLEVEIFVLVLQNKRYISY